MTINEAVSTRARITWWLRLQGALLSVACASGAIYVFWTYRRETDAWWLLAAALAVSVMWQWGLYFDRPSVPRGAARPRRVRMIIGGAIALGGGLLWAWSSRALFGNWLANFDRAWMAWVAAAVCLSIGMDIASGPWRSSTKSFSRWHLALLLVLVVVAAAYRLGNIQTFPGEGTATQVEDLQTGQFGYWYQNGGSRLRWEYLSHVWLAALGIWLGGPTMTAMRIPFAVVSVLKTVPLFLWLHFAVGPVGAAVGTALYVFSAWDVILSRIPNNHNALVVATAFALLAGPVRRGRPSAFVWLGLFGGYVLFEYVAYRPLTFFVLAGATWLSLRDASAHWLARAARPLVTLGLIVSMAVPLFHRITPARIWQEYFNGWNRAHIQSQYYNPTDTWRQALERRIDRSFQAAALFFFSGDSNPGRQVNQSLVDHVTAVFLVVGMGCAIAHAREPIFGLTLVGFVATVAGTLVMTGNFDIGRVGGAVPYVYALVGYGAASLAALVRTRARPVRLAILGLSAAAVIWAGWLNTEALSGYWSSTDVRRALRHNLAYLSGWLGANVRDGERVIAIAPGFFNVLETNDAAWLRGREIEGVAAWDVESALRSWMAYPGKAVLIVFAGKSTSGVTKYLEWLLPGLTLEQQPDPLGAGGDLAYTHLDAVPPQLGLALDHWRCRGGTAEYQLIGAQPGEPLFRMTSVAPFVDASTIPNELRERVYRSQPPASQVLARYEATFILPDPGEYDFDLEIYIGTGKLRVDGQQYRQRSRVALQAGAHTLEIQASLEPVPTLMGIRLLWSGPGTGGAREIMPLYRLSGIDPACESEAERAAVPGPVP